MVPYSMSIHPFLTVSHIKHRAIFQHLSIENLSFFIFTNKKWAYKQTYLIHYAYEGIMSVKYSALMPSCSGQ